MLKKIDCIMVKVPDVEKAASFYEECFGLRALWRDEHSVGLTMSDTDAEIVLHNNPDIPVNVDVNYLVDDVPTATERLQEKGFKCLAQPFNIPIGKCVVVQDPFGQVWSLLDMSKGPRVENYIRP